MNVCGVWGHKKSKRIEYIWNSSRKSGKDKKGPTETPVIVGWTARPLLTLSTIKIYSYTIGITAVKALLQFRHLHQVMPNLW